jgi:hypothetical protein
MAAKALARARRWRVDGARRFEASEFQGDDRRPDRCSSDRGGSRSGALNRKQRWEPGRRHYAQKEGMLRSASVKLHAAPGTLACCTTTLHVAPAAAATGLARLHGSGERAPVSGRMRTA